MQTGRPVGTEDRFMVARSWGGGCSEQPLNERGVSSGGDESVLGGSCMAMLDRTYSQMVHFNSLKNNIFVQRIEQKCERKIIFLLPLSMIFLHCLSALGDVV